jgi:hypothetical protein
LFLALPKVNRFSIYGLTNQAKTDWQIESLWNDPARPGRWYPDGSICDSTQQKHESPGTQNDKPMNVLKADSYD